MSAPVSVTLPAGRELDALIAERVMGWAPLGIGPNGLCANGAGRLAEGWRGYWDGNWTRWIEMPPPSSDDADRATPWSPSTDIAAAWEVVEKLLPDYNCYIACAGRGWDVQFAGEHPPHAEALAETAPLAICRAALKAVEP